MKVLLYAHIPHLKLKCRILYLLLCRCCNAKVCNIPIFLHCFLIFSSFFFRPLLKQIKSSAESHIVLDCSTERIYDVLKQAQQIGMMTDYHSYLITSLVSVVAHAAIIIAPIIIIIIIRRSVYLHTTITSVANFHSP